MATSAEVSASGGGVSFIGILTIVFIVLKLTGVIEWTWIWVLSPIWISMSVVIVILFLIMLVAIVAGMKK